MSETKDAVLNENKTSENANAENKLRKAVTPKQIQIEGEIVDVNRIEYEDKATGDIVYKGTLITIYNAKSGKNIDVMSSDNQLAVFKSGDETYQAMINRRPACVATVNENIGGVTSYVKDGKTYFHDRDGFSLQKITPMGNLQMSRINSMNARRAELDIQLDTMDEQLERKIQVLRKRGMSEEQIDAALIQLMK